MHANVFSQELLCPGNITWAVSNVRNVMKALLLLLACFALPAAAQEWKMDATQSRLGFNLKQMNVPTEGGFKRFLATASFDPVSPEAGQFKIDVDINSIDTGSDEGDSEVKRPVWFDTARYPRATFASTRLRKEANGSLTVFGNLTIKGQTRPYSVPFSLVRQPGGGYLAQGRFQLKRSDFGIGGGDWDEVVANDVDVRFKIVLLP
jgi:polyisoprenoid-binding protein YceI